MEQGTRPMPASARGSSMSRGTTVGSSQPFHSAVPAVRPLTMAPALRPTYTTPAEETICFAKAPNPDLEGGRRG
eukprot:1036650-Prorocentrum_minimum.AAC.1